MPDNNPRFKSAHDAGKYISAQLYPTSRGLNPEEFGAIKRYTENPEWQKAKFSVGEHVLNGQPGLGIIYLQHDESMKTSAEWYALQQFAIVFPDGFPSGAGFYEFWNYVEISKEEFDRRMDACVLLD